MIRARCLLRLGAGCLAFSFPVYPDVGCQGSDFLRSFIGFSYPCKRAIFWQKPLLSVNQKIQCFKLPYNRRAPLHAKQIKSKQDYLSSFFESSKGSILHQARHVPQPMADQFHLITTSFPFLFLNYIFKKKLILRAILIVWPTSYNNY